MHLGGCLVLVSLACTAMAQIGAFNYEQLTSKSKTDPSMQPQPDMLLPRNPLRMLSRQRPHREQQRDPRPGMASTILEMPDLRTRHKNVQPTFQTFQSSFLRSQVEQRPQPQNRPPTRPEPQTRPQTRPEPQTRPQTRPQPQIRPQTRPESQIRPQTRPESQIRPQTRPQIRPETRPQPQMRPQTRPQPRPQPQPQPNFQPDAMFLEPSQVPNCPLESHPDTENMFIMRGPKGAPEPRACSPGTYFLRSVCTCVMKPLDKCNLRPSALGIGWYEERVFDLWMQRPCGPGSAYSHNTCDCSLTL